MPKPRKGPRLGAGPSHQKHLLSGQAASLIMHEAITTTEAKAKALRPVAERLITYAKRGDVAARREVLKVIPDRDVGYKLFSDLGPRYSERNGEHMPIVHGGVGAGLGAACRPGHTAQGP